MSTTLNNRIEAILYASGKGASVEDLAEYTEKRKQDVRKALKKLREEYDKRDTSLQIREYNGKWKLGVKEEYVEDVKRIVSETELAASILKTLAIIAYKSPVLQSDIVDMRGQGAYDHIKELVKSKFITKEKSGRSYILKVTEKFYEYFDVEGDEEIREVFDNLREEQVAQQKLQVVSASEKKEQDKAQEEEKESKETLGGLQIVDINEQPSRTSSEILKKEKEQEKEFLDDLDKRLTKVSERVEKHYIGERREKKPEENNNNEPNETARTKIHAETESTSEQKQTANKNTEEKTETEDPDDKRQHKEQPLEKIEQFLEQEKKKKKNSVKYL
ncbi:MAG: SMC-Scp complex subunit ScpB [Nanoarchaeota archaeon]